MGFEPMKGIPNRFTVYHYWPLSHPPEFNNFNLKSLNMIFSFYKCLSLLKNMERMGFEPMVHGKCTLD